jgi:hypothetical protein
VGDADPIGDVCSTGTVEVSMAGKNIGDLLNAQNVTWGWFKGGFNLDRAAQRQRQLWLQSQYAGHARQLRDRSGLHPAPPAVPVLRPTANPEASAPQLRDLPSAARIEGTEPRPTRPTTSTILPTSSPP